MHTYVLKHTQTHNGGRTHESEVLLPLAPSTLVLREMFKELGTEMNVVPLTPRLIKLLDLSADVSSLLTCKPMKKEDKMQEDETADKKDRRRSDGELLADLAARVFSIETLLFPYALTREWTLEKRNAFRRRLASVRCVLQPDRLRACTCPAAP